METTPTTPPAIAPPGMPDLPVPQTSLAARMMNVFAAPGDVFAELKASPRNMANYLVPVLLSVVVGWICSACIMSQDAFKHQFSELAEKGIDAQLAKLKAQGKLSKEQLDQSREAMLKVSSYMAEIGQYAAPAAFGLVLPLFYGLFLWVAGSNIMKGGFTFLKALEAAGLCMMLESLETVVKTLLIFTVGNVFASPSLALLVIKEYDPQNLLHGLLTLANVMTFWILTVRTIALSRLAGVSIWKAAAWVVGLWAVMNSMFLGLAAGGKAMAAH